MAIQAPSGTQLEVPIPEMVCRISFLKIDLLSQEGQMFSYQLKKLTGCEHFQITAFKFPTWKYWYLNLDDFSKIIEVTELFNILIKSFIKFDFDLENIKEWAMINSHYSLKNQLKLLYL